MGVAQRQTRPTAILVPVGRHDAVAHALRAVGGADNLEPVYRGAGQPPAAYLLSAPLTAAQRARIAAAAPAATVRIGATKYERPAAAMLAEQGLRRTRPSR